MQLTKSFVILPYAGSQKSVLDMYLNIFPYNFINVLSVNWITRICFIVRYDFSHRVEQLKIKKVKAKLNNYIQMETAVIFV